MKLRLQPGKVSYRLELDDLDRLLEKGKLQQDIILPTGHLYYDVVCLPAGAPPQFEACDYRLSLALPRDRLIAHKADLPCLKGIIISFPTPAGPHLDVALEVNLKRKRKHQMTR